MLRPLDLVVEGRVFFLQVAGVGQDDPAQVDGRRRRVDRAGETFFHEAWNPSAVVKMSVREDHGIDLARGNRQLFPVAFSPLFLALKQAAIDEDLNSLPAIAVKRSVDQMLRPGHRTGRAKELNVGQGFLQSAATNLTRRAQRYGEGRKERFRFPLCLRVSAVRFWFFGRAEEPAFTAPPLR